MHTELQGHPGMLALARDSRGMTQAEVAAAMTKASAQGETPVSQGYVSRAEGGRLVVTGERLELYAHALGYPPELLTLDPRTGGVGVGLVHHRKRAALSATALKAIHAQLALSRIQLDGLVGLPEGVGSRHSFPEVTLDALTTPKDAARRVRRDWRMPPGPVADLVATVEAAGGWVIIRDLGSDLLDAVSQRAGMQEPLFLLNSRAPGDRCRFSMAHELGHLVMHHQPGASADQEKQADAFAAEFLMPAADIRGAFSGIVDLNLLIGLKRQWRVSMAALLRRAQTLGILSEWQYRTLTIEMSALGYRTSEPVVVDPEIPRRVTTVIDRQLVDESMDCSQLAARAYLLSEDFQRLYVHCTSEHVVDSPADAKART